MLVTVGMGEMLEYGHYRVGSVDQAECRIDSHNLDYTLYTLIINHCTLQVSNDNINIVYQKPFASIVNRVDCRCSLR